MRKESLEITTTPAFQALLYRNPEILAFRVERVKGKNPLFPESPEVLHWDRQTLFALLQLPLQWLFRFLPYVREYELIK